jgi:hypothetical protein
MRLKIDTSEVKFRAAGTTRPKKDYKDADKQAMTKEDSPRPIWTVRLTAIEPGRETAETIWVEVAGDEPKVTLDELVQVHGLVFAPWVGRDNKIKRAFRADAVTAMSAAHAKAA